MKTLLMHATTLLFRIFSPSLPPTSLHHFPTHVYKRKRLLVDFLTPIVASGWINGDLQKSVLGDLKTGIDYDIYNNI